MDFSTYRHTQLVNLRWSGRPDFPPSAELLSWIPMATSPRQVALELGCCDGKTLPLLWRKGYHTVGCELFLDLAQKAASQTLVRQQRYLHVVVGDAQALPLADRSVDIILADNGPEHWWSVGHAMREVARVLRRPGSLFAAAPLAAESLSPAHLWSVDTVGAMVDALHQYVPEARVVQVAEMIDGPERQILMHFHWG